MATVTAAARALGLAVGLVLVAVAEAAPAPAELAITVGDAGLSVALRQAPRDAVLQAIARRAGIAIRVEGALDGTVTESFEALRLERGLRRLFPDAHMVFVYGTDRLTHVWLFATAAPAAAGAWRPQPTPGESANPDGPTLARLIEATRSDEPRVRLAALHRLQQADAADGDDVLSAFGVALADEDPAVKGYAVYALAERGGRRALEYLREAVHDPDPAARRLVIDSLAPVVERQPGLSRFLGLLDD